MSGQYYMPLWTDAYLGDTKHLTTVQHGAYLLLLITMWRNGGTLPNDEKRLARTVGLQPDRWRKINKEVLALFEIEGDHITQKRLSLELKKTIDLTQKRATAGGAGGRAKSLKTKGSGVASATPELQQKGSLQIQNQIQIQDPTERKEEGEEAPSNVVEFPPLPWEVATPAEGSPAEPASSSEDQPDRPKGKPERTYAFEAGIIRLTQSDLERWIRIYSFLNVEAELLALAQWAKREHERPGGNWFNAVSGALTKKNREISLQMNTVKAKAEADAKIDAKPKRKLI
jgi:uncharacterized protein YdaU (DUF1376 family)